MRKIFAAVVAASALLSPAIASADSFVSSGFIESVNGAANTISIRGGDVYKLPSSVNVSRLHSGERVDVFWNTQDTRSISIGNGQYATGVQATGVHVAH